MPEPRECPTCHLRRGLGSCSPCATSAAKAGGVEDIDEFALLADDYLRWPDKRSPEAVRRASVLLSWLQGASTDLRNQPLLSPNAMESAALFDRFQEATQFSKGQMMEVIGSFGEWAAQGGGDFWFQETGGALLIAVKFDDKESGIYLWFANPVLTAQIHPPKQADRGSTA